MQIAAVLLCLLPLTPPPSAHAVHQRTIQVYLDSGLGFTPTPLVFNDVQLPERAFFVGGGFLLPLSPPVRAFVDLSYARFTAGRSTSEYAAFGLTPIAKPSHLETLLLGLQLESPTRGMSGPIATAGIGLGRMAPGDLTILFSDLPATYANQLHIDTQLGPAFEIGIGLRTASLHGGPQATFGFRVIGILTNAGDLTLVPVTIGVVF